jgi:hypothetical protein
MVQANAAGTLTSGPQVISGSATLDFPSTSAGNSSELSVSLSGISDGDVVMIGVPSGSAPANSNYTAYVNNAGTAVIVRFNNYSSGAIDPASGTFKVTVMH